MSADGLTFGGGDVFTWALYAVPLFWLARALITTFFRWLGLSHPAHYRWWPRLPWRSFWIVIMRVKEWRELFRMGRKATAGWVGIPAALTMMYRPGQVLLGRMWGFGFGWLQPIGLKATRHLAMFAMTGAGKTTFLVTLVSTWAGSCAIVDPKFQVTQALRRVRGKTWVVLDPYGLGDAPSAIWNVYDEVKAAIERDGWVCCVRWMQKIAESLVITSPGNRSPFFPDAARQFVVSLLLYILLCLPPEQHNLVVFRRLLNRGHDDVASDPDEAFATLLYGMRQCDAFGGAVANGASALENMGNETRGNVLGTAREATKWLDDPRIHRVVGGQSAALCADLKTRDDLVLSLGAPVSAIREELAPFARLLTNTIIHVFETVRAPQRKPCLLAVDEMPAQGYNRAIETAAPVMRSYGLQLLAIAQDIAGVKAAYPTTWETFISNADAVFWMAANSQDTISYLEKVLGTTTHLETIDEA